MFQPQKKKKKEKYIKQKYRLSDSQAASFEESQREFAER
jgi:hypothetical protein